MRVTERLMYGLGIIFTGSVICERRFGLVSHQTALILDDSIIVLILLTAFTGAMYEGIRFQQYLFLLAYFSVAILVFMEIYSEIALGIFALILVVSIVNAIVFGEATFKSLKMKGPFQVGH
mmetsp:Transcript_24451/g.37916  ORF Transcript_24451/g.37916 Transcript_24451/m.37916 type:complete len:121 (+) Transcript_24451:1-363(+)